MDIKEKLWGRLEEELCEILEYHCWTPKHAETAHYIVEMMRDIKKMEYYEKEEEMVAKRMPPPPPPTK